MVAARLADMTAGRNWDNSANLQNKTSAAKLADIEVGDNQHSGAANLGEYSI